MKHLLTRVALLLAVLLTSTVGVYAQTTLTSTTLGAAVTTTSQSVVSVASATGITAAGNGSTLVYLLVDRELMYVTSVTGTNIGVVRAASSTRAATHLSGATVWVAPPQAVFSYIPSGQCTRTNLTYVPWVVGGAPGVGTEVGSLYDCLGVTSSGQWVRTDANDKPVLGSTVASPAGVMTLTGSFVKVSGTNAVTGITVPAGTAPGFCFAIEPTGAFTTTNATNINIASTAVVGKLLNFCWSGTKWDPSY